MTRPPLPRAAAAALAAAVAVLVVLAAAPAAAQQPRALTADDYARAERFMGYNTTPLVFGASVRPVWLAGDRFWYRNTIPEGAEFVVVDPARRTRARAFDHTLLAAALARAADTTLDAFHLPFQTFTFSPDGRSLIFDALGRRWTCGVAGGACSGEPGRRERPVPNAVLSPDSTKAAFIRDFNLWVRDVATGRETQLTTDGVKDFGYATDNAGWTKSDRPILLWSPDSRRIATFQQDERGVGEMYLVRTRVGHPVLEQWHYPLPGDSVITTIQRVVIDLEGPRVVRLRMPPDQHRSTLCDHVTCGGGWADVFWSPDAARLVFVSTSRDHRVEDLRVADAATGEVRDVYQERANDFFESGFNRVNWQPLWAANELLWYSERTDWGHLYLYDLATGRLKNPITSGSWKVLQVLRLDTASRTIFFTAAGREPGDPYFRKLYSVRLDGSRLQLLTPEDADHDVTLAPDGRCFVDTYS
ncbi:MAG TPA: DPP IV N-terminal domain-containing protein, partial [Frankiaceae bacterium]|nr:DPP IV N-terminal domain-containing protein [Frankiaceae bacterium]